MFGFVASCNESKEQTFMLPNNASYLIAGDSIKTWKLEKRFNNGYRMNMGDCFLSYQISYLKNGSMYDNNDDFQDCGESLKASWMLVINDNGSFIKLSSEQLPKLLNSNNNYKYFQIDELTKEKLILRFEHSQYSNKTSVIIDHLVPETMNIENRDFHH